ncbi:MAG TPA: NAD(P)-dependent oxidoreductase, partial [Bacteroidota bacterium]
SNGLLGQKVTELFVRGTNYQIMLSSLEPAPVFPVGEAQYAAVDLTVKKQVKQLVSSFEPDVIINCAAMTNVDACEKEREQAWKVNVGSVEHLIEAARRADTRIVHISSDYIFDGKSGPYGEDARPEPLSYYGKTKLASENALRTSGLPHFIARTMILYGFAPGAKANFALWLLQSLENGTQVRIVDDQWGNPTLADDLAYGIMRGVELGKTGIYNIAGREICTRYDFAIRLAKTFGLDPALIAPVKTAELRQPAPRPLKSGLITLKAETDLGIRPSNVEEGLIVLKSQITRTLRRLGDSSAVQSGRGSRKR